MQGKSRQMFVHKEFLCVITRLELSRQLKVDVLAIEAKRDSWKVSWFLIAKFSGYTDRPSYRGAPLLKTSVLRVIANMNEKLESWDLTNISLVNYHFICKQTILTFLCNILGLIESSKASGSCLVLKMFPEKITISKYDRHRKSI